MYFDSKITRPGGLPWLSSLSSGEKASNDYFENLENIVVQIDDIEASTNFISDLSVDDFDSGYQFVLTRIKELRDYLVNVSTADNKDVLLDNLRDVFDELKDLSLDATLYDDDTTDDDNLDFDNLDEIDFDDDDFEDDDDFDKFDDDFDDDDDDDHDDW